jgi:hypothetical protein
VYPRRVPLVAVLSVPLLVLVLVGCGGGGGAGPAGTGALSVSVIFPAREAPQPAALPRATASVKLTLTPAAAPGDPNPPAASWTVERLLASPPGGGPVSTQIRDLLPGWIKIVAEAYATPDATGEVIAVASLTFRLAGGKTTRLGLTTAALCTSVRVQPTSLLVLYEQTALVEANALDADGNVLLGAAFDWVSSNPAVATVDADGQVRGKAEGVAWITATDRASGKSASCEVTVSEWADEVTLSVPLSSAAGVSSPVLQAGQRYRFVATGVWYPWGTETGPTSERPADAVWYAPREASRRDDPTAWIRYDNLRIDALIPDWLGSADGTTWAPDTVSLGSHEYRFEYLGTGASVRFWLSDDPYYDNTGELNVTIQRHR